MTKRCEADVAADMLRLLVRANLVSSQSSLKQIEDATGITRADIARADSRAAQSDRPLVFSRTPFTFEPPPAPVEEVNGRTERDRIFNAMTHAERFENWVETSDRARWTVDGELEISCSGMKVNGQHWAPLEEFSYHSEPQKAHRPLTGCKKCKAAYQSLRHVRVAQRAQLDQAGISIELRDGDPSFVCSTCGLPISEGDKVHFVGKISHAACVVDMDAVDEYHSNTETVKGDGPGHELTSECPCMPRVEIVVREDDGVACEHVIHNAWEERFR